MGVVTPLRLTRDTVCVSAPGGAAVDAQHIYWLLLPARAATALGIFPLLQPRRTIPIRQISGEMRDI